VHGRQKDVLVENSGSAVSVHPLLRNMPLVEDVLFNL
jgi:hypothetical protein